MIQSRKFVAAAILVGLALIVVGMLIAPFNAPARAAAGEMGIDVASDRIGIAFASLSERDPHPAIAAAAARASKGDFGASRCNGAVWPNIDASCLSTADGSAAQPVRMITIGYQADSATTVLVRFPDGEVASR